MWCRHFENRVVKENSFPCVFFSSYFLEPWNRVFDQWCSWFCEALDMSGYVWLSRLPLQKLVSDCNFCLSFEVLKWFEWKMSEMAKRELFLVCAVCQVHWTTKVSIIIFPQSFQHFFAAILAQTWIVLAIWCRVWPWASGIAFGGSNVQSVDAKHHHDTC